MDRKVRENELLYRLVAGSIRQGLLTISEGAAALEISTDLLKILLMEEDTHRFLVSSVISPERNYQDYQEVYEHLRRDRSAAGSCAAYLNITEDELCSLRSKTAEVRRKRLGALRHEMMTLPDALQAAG